MLRKKVHLCCFDHAHKRLKIMAAEHGCTMGQLLEALVSLAYHGTIPKQVLELAVKDTPPANSREDGDD